MKLYVRLKEETIVDFYNAVARQLGYSDEAIATDLNYDCRKICVSEERADLIENAYPSRESFGMTWLMCGPKAVAVLHNEEVEIEEGFIVRLSES